MYRLRVNTVDIIYHIACLIEDIYPYGYEFNADVIWELFDDCFIDDELQNYKDSDLYEGYVNHVPSDILNSTFEEIHELINTALTCAIPTLYRRTLPDTVIYKDNGIYELRWRRETCS